MRTFRVPVVTLLLAMGLVSSSAFAQIQGGNLELTKEAGTPSFLRRASNRLEPKRETGKIAFLYKASNLYLLGGTTVDMITTARLMNHPTMAYRADGSALGLYSGVETGWARCLGRKNTGATVMANVALNAGVGLLSRKLYRRGGHWRIVAIAVNVLKGTNSMVAGIHNIRYDRDEYVRKATGYKGQVVWSH